MAQTVKALAERCSNAYSTNRYRGGWNGCVSMLRRRGYSDTLIETVIRSKWTRWAADASDMPYGRVTSTALANYLNNMQNEKRELESLAQVTLCGVRDCFNEATHTWSGHPTCDDCGTPSRKE